jgi:hypothetical protein
MKEIIDELQLKINGAKNKLSKETLEAIDSFNWKEVLLQLGQKKLYNEEQLEDLEMNTELLLCGLLNPDAYQNDLEIRMKISKDEVTSLINEIDESIFKKIQEELEKRLEGGAGVTKKVEAVVEKTIDPRFSSLPNEVKKAIIASDWKEKLFEIAKGHKLNILQMGVLDDITIKIMLGTMHPENYESELSKGMTIPSSEVSSIVSEVNENILTKIREFMQKEEESSKQKVVSSKGGESSMKYVVSSNEEEKIPIPPYKKIEDKLKMPTKSEHTVTDYSKTSDPYREEI